MRVSEGGTGPVGSGNKCSLALMVPLPPARSCHEGPADTFLRPRTVEPHLTGKEEEKLFGQIRLL